MKYLVSFGSIFLLFLHTAALGSGIEEIETVAGFAARMVTTVQATTSIAEIKGTPDMMRMQVMGGRTFSTMIARFDRNVVWLLAPTGRQYREMGLDDMGAGVPHFFRKDLQIERTKIGEGEVSGIPAIQYEAEIIGPDGRHYSGILWEAKEPLPLPLKWEDRPNNLDVTWEGIVSQPIAVSLFEIPPGYMKVEEAGGIRSRSLPR